MMSRVFLGVSKSPYVGLILLSQVSHRSPMFAPVTVKSLSESLASRHYILPRALLSLAGLNVALDVLIELLARGQRISRSTGPAAYNKRRISPGTLTVPRRDPHRLGSSPSSAARRGLPSLG